MNRSEYDNIMISEWDIYIQEYGTNTCSVCHCSVGERNICCNDGHSDDYALHINPVCVVCCNKHKAYLGIHRGQHPEGEGQ